MDQFLLITAGAFLATLGGCIGHVLVAQLSRDAERRRVRREKLERLATVAISVNDWLKRYEEDYLAYPSRTTPADPAEDMYMLTNLYFREVRMEVHRYCQAIGDFEVSIVRHGKRRSEQRDRGNPEWSTAGLGEFTEERSAKLPIILLRLNELMCALSSLALKIDDDDWITKAVRYVWNGSRSDSSS